MRKTELLIVAIAIAYGCSNRRILDPLPGNAEITQVRATLHGREGLSKSVEEFDVPMKYAARLLDLFRNSVTESGQSWFQSDPLGVLRIETSTGRTRTIEFYSTGKTRIYFKIDGREFRRAGQYHPFDAEWYLPEALTVARILEEIHLLEKKKIDQTFVKNMESDIDIAFDDLFRSMGRDKSNF